MSDKAPWYGVLSGVILAASVACAAASPGRVAAQAAPDAVTVAGSVQSFYERTTGVRARFFQTYYHKLYNRYERSQGAVTFRKPGKMRWDYARPNGKVITSDGRKLIVFEPGDGSEPGQVFEQELSANQLPQAFAFLTGTARLADDFSFRLLDARRQGFADGFVLELRPRAPTPHYDRILFFVAARDGRPLGVVRRVLIVDAAGNRNRFDFAEMQFNPTAEDRVFVFQPPAGTRRVRP